MVIHICSDVLREIQSTIGTYEIESGGVIGAVEGAPISAFYYDKNGKTSQNHYTPDIISINQVLINDWSKRSISMVGIVHSHERTCMYPSCGDLEYGKRILLSPLSPKIFLLPIVTLEPFTLHMYSIKLGKNGRLNTYKEQYDVV